MDSLEHIDPINQGAETLFRAIHENNLQLVTGVCDQFAAAIPEITKVTNEEGRTPLLEAMVLKRPELVHFLVERLDVNDSGAAPYTPLHLAAQQGDLSLTKLLLEHGAEVDAKDLQGRTPIYYSLDGDVAKTLIDAGTNLESSGVDGMRPVHWHARQGNAKVLILLGSNGANLSSKAGNDVTPLHLAAVAGHVDVVEFLASQVDCNLPTAAGDKAIDWVNKELRDLESPGLEQDCHRIKNLKKVRRTLGPWGRLARSVCNFTNRKYRI